MPLHEAPRHERPGLEPLQVGQPGRCRAAHPRLRVGVLLQEPAGGTAPLELDALGDRQRVDVGVVGREQLRAGPQRCRGQVGGRDAHHGEAFRAAAYSAARVSADRCTYLPVVSGLACPIRSRSTSKSMPAAASSVP